MRHRKKKEERDKKDREEDRQRMTETVKERYHR
jgi:hypothetical protein